MKTYWNRFIRDEEGASGIEYALVAAMVAIALVTFVEPINDAIFTIFDKIKEAIERAAENSSGTGEG